MASTSGRGGMEPCVAIQNVKTTRQRQPALQPTAIANYTKKHKQRKLVALSREKHMAEAKAPPTEQSGHGVLHTMAKQKTKAIYGTCQEPKKHRDAGGVLVLELELALFYIDTE